MKMKTRLITVITALAAVNLAFGGQNVTGTIKLSGSAPSEKNMTKAIAGGDPYCKKAHAGKTITTTFYKVGDGKELGDVVVYLEGIKGKFDPPAEKPLLDQVDCLYNPYVLSVQSNQKIAIRNSDSTLHNVHSFPKPKPGNRGFNFAQVIKGKVNEKSFSKAEMFIRFKCDVHPWMFAYVSVFDHPYHAVTKEDGSYTLKDVPPGKYTLVAAHRKGKKLVKKQIEVKGGDLVVDLAVAVK
ncbi:MAG TPA: hypothetical protein EYQ50_22945 [Verrucomicrobiales bacterium]|nr:hypothetical protein [Verrucomicrobiales bacterium]